MEVDRFCHGHGLTRAGFIGRGAIAGGALLAGSAGLAGAAKADDGDDGHRHVPQPFEVPNTPLARAVVDFAASAYPAFLANHCQRSYDVATLIASHGGVSVDLEVLYAGILLHDLGLTPGFHSASSRFEVASADAARAFVRDHGLSPQRSEQVWDVVVLHGTGGIARWKSIETFVAADGIGRDVTGLDLDEFPRDVVDRIMATPARLRAAVHRRDRRRSPGQAAGRERHLDDADRNCAHPRLPAHQRRDACLQRSV
jgi:hypothetical protein